MANEQRPKGECPFCGSEAYECVTRWMGDGQYRRAAAYYRCRKCYARGPVISSEREYDVRNERPSVPAYMGLQMRAFSAWRGDVAAIFPPKENQPDLFNDDAPLFTGDGTDEGVQI
jgi:hypothetical protein